MDCVEDNVENSAGKPPEIEALISLEQLLREATSDSPNMEKMRELVTKSVPTAQRAVSLGLVQKGWTGQKIAQAVGETIKAESK